jgi:hypothetical protein
VAGVALGKQLIILALGFGLLALPGDFCCFQSLKWISLALYHRLALPRCRHASSKVREADGPATWLLGGPYGTLN